MIFIGIDNGVSGSIGIIYGEGYYLYAPIPVKRELNYTKTKKWIHRIDINKLRILLPTSKPEILVGLERPMVNPGRFQATASALRALESTLILLEELEFPYRYLDSKEWQKSLLPKDLKGEELKEASLSIGKRLFPSIDFKGFKDADGLLIAEYLRRTQK